MRKRDSLIYVVSYINQIRGLKMHDQAITLITSVFLALCTLIVMGCTLWLLFMGDTLEFIAGLVASLASVYAFIDVSRDLNKGA